MTMGTTHRERRKTHRLEAITYALSVNEEILAEIIDISKCGISCRSLMTDNKPLLPITEIGLLNCESGSSVENLACRMVRVAYETIDKKTFVNFSVEFQNLTTYQRNKLDQFIKTT
jgi:c-di-GMP-binding flagellar brake protein YcgR